MGCKSICNVANKSLKLFEVIVHERRLSERHRLVAKTVEKYGVFRRRDDQSSEILN